MFEAWFGLAGVLLGFVLGAGYEQWKERQKTKLLKMQLLEELRANRAMIPWKKDIIQQILSVLPRGQLLPGESVRFCTTVYDAHYPAICHALPMGDRHSLHVIYENLRTVDSVMFSYRNHVMENLADAKVYISMYTAMMSDLLKTLDVTHRLLGCHLEGQPEDVFHLTDERANKSIGARSQR